MLRRSTLPLGLPCLLAGFLAACEPTTGPRLPGPSLAEVDSRVVDAYTRFGFDAFSRLVDQEPDGNIFFSGTSLAFALAMTYHGTAGETRSELARALGVEGIDVATLHQSNAAWLAALLDTARDAELAIGNSVWARRGFDFEADFLERNRLHYRAEVDEIDFDDPASVDVINAWVSEQTRGRIDEIIQEIDPLDIMFLINALYFLGEWTTPFDEDATSEGRFQLPDASWKPIPMMTRLDTIAYHAASGYQAVRLPYGDDERFAMYVFLPDPDRSLADFYAELDAEEWERRIAALEPTYLELGMPRFRLEYEKQLIPTLEDLGIERAFDPERSDFSPMTRAREDVYISEVLQKTFVQVNEKGTEAAAVTAVRVGVTSLPMHPVMLVDRPFFFAIRDDATGTVLFQGQIADPEDPEWEG